MSICWCDWCTLSAKECLDESHTKGMIWTIDLMKKSLNGQIGNEKITSYEKKYVKTLLFDFVPIENYILTLLHARIGVGNKIVYSYFEWINKRIESICEQGQFMTNLLINIKIERNSHQQIYDAWIKIIVLDWLN